MRIREAIVTQQNVLAEQRARTVKGEYYDDDYNSVHEDYKASAGFSGGDAKKRRGVSINHVRRPPGKTDQSIESCAAWSLSQLQPSGNSRMEERSRRRSNPLQCVRTTLRQVDPENGRQ